MTPGVTSILLVDDDPAILRLLARWLEQAGYRVTTARDGYEAKQAIERECPHVVVTDWEMPHVDGLELCRWVRGQNLPHYVYLLFLTVRAGLSDLVRGLESGADDFLKKPIDKDELLARLRSAKRVLDLEERLGVLARCDALTGLASRRTFFEFLNREWSRSQRYRFPLSCVMVDIDYFKRINDTHGHAAGDEVIRRVADCLSAGCRTSDIVSRHGGEEFCLLLPETIEHNAATWADRMRQKLAALRIEFGGKTLQITASLGVAQRMSDTATSEQLVDMADQALIVAKRTGRDRVATFASLSQATPLPASSSSPAVLLQNVAARQVMTTLVAGLDQNDTVDVASRYFLRFRIAIAAVIDEEGKLVGVLSEKDVMAAMLQPEWWKMRIQDVMRANVVCYEEETPALTIYEFLCRVTLRAAVIVNQGRPTGLITRGSLLRYFTNALSVGGHLAGESPLLEQLEASSSGERTSAEDVRRRILQTVRAVNDEALDLRERLDVASQDLVPCLVGGASRIQELANDLLACSRFAGERAEPQEHGMLLG
ncbi:Response regulator PleD [Anatilimnocola aggregata]|uniref:diguanylate cyclase n=1 Tax=Anatilimnocola aggregata TaxID=2528021 RepID=A0A517Y756_9BACT|nr:diguanylate cyclase [Anatilimnocola aggregata]QDU26068.1 Response regulator PleD [Anatilimnocola aggregata]